MVALRKIRLQRYDIILIYANKTPQQPTKKLSDNSSNSSYVAGPRIELGTS